MTTGQDGVKVVSHTNLPTLTPGNAPGTHFCYRLSQLQCHSKVRRILYQWQITMTPAEIEPATYQFVVQYLTHCAAAVPHQSHWLDINPYVNLRNLTISVIYVSLFLQITQHCPYGYKTQQHNNGVACLIVALDNILCGPHKTQFYVL